MRRITIAEAREQGYTVDTTVYPHFAYKGSRFMPNARVLCFTSDEAELIAALQRMQRMHSLMMAKTNHGASFYDAKCLQEMNEAPIQAARVLTELGLEQNKEQA